MIAALSDALGAEGREVAYLVFLSAPIVAPVALTLLAWAVAAALAARGARVHAVGALLAGFGFVGWELLALAVYGGYAWDATFVGALVLAVTAEGLGYAALVASRALDEDDLQGPNP